MVTKEAARFTMALTLTKWCNRKKWHSKLFVSRILSLSAEPEKQAFVDHYMIRMMQKFCTHKVVMGDRLKEYP